MVYDVQFTNEYAVSIEADSFQVESYSPMTVSFYAERSLIAVMTNVEMVTDRDASRMVKM